MATLVEPTDPIRPFPLGPPRPVDPAAIERGLGQFWADAATALPAATGTGVVRSCTLNFVVVLTPDDRAGEVADVVATLTLRHPCRIFMLTADAAAKPPGLDAAVAALCHLPGPGLQHICCEQITVVAKGAAVSGLPHLLLALLVPDLPLMVWWRGCPGLGVSLFDELSRIADRMIIDTAECVDAVRDMARLPALLQRQPSVVLADLAWNRLTRWRTLVAQFFDTAEPRGYLDRLDRISVDVIGDAAGPEVILWLGWIASRLGWTPKSGSREARRCVYTFGGRRDVQVEVRTRAGDDPYVVHAVTLAVSDSPDVRFSLERHDAHALQVAAQVPGMPLLSRIVPMAVRDTAVVLCDELDAVGHDQMFEEALAVGGRLAGFLIA